MMIPTEPGLVEAGLIEQQADCPAVRVIALAHEIALKREEIVEAMTESMTVYHVVEIPAKFGHFGKQAPTYIPLYGMAVGAACVAFAQYPTTTVHVRADAWPWRGLPTTRNDPHKERRVAYVEQTWKIPKGNLGSKTKAGNIADAILMIDWFRNRVSSGLWGLSAHKGRSLVMAIDPASRVTGYAIAVI